MGRIIQETALKPGYRVITEVINWSIPYRIASQQHYSTYSDSPDRECDSEGWRDCLCEYAKTDREAREKHVKLVASERRWI